jgi:hypothetical protein
MAVNICKEREKERERKQCVRSRDHKQQQTEHQQRADEAESGGALLPHARHAIVRRPRVVGEEPVRK